MKQIAVVGLALLAACGNEWSGRTTNYQVKVHVIDMPTSTRVYADGELLGTFAQDGELSLRRKDRGARLTRRENAVTAEVLTPDGWKKAWRVDVDRRAPEWEEAEVKAGRPVPLDLTIVPGDLAAPCRFHVAIDNRGLPACKVSIGAVPIDVPGDQTWRGTLPTPATAEGTVVRCNDREIGRVATASDQERKRKESGVFSTSEPWWILDVGGKRAYSKRLVHYRPIGSFDRTPPSGKVRIDPAPLHDLGFLLNPSLFMPAPSTMSGSSGYDSRWEILDEP